MRAKDDGRSSPFRFDDLTPGRRDLTGDARTREASTLATYARHARSLFKQAGQLSETPTGKRIAEVIHWFVERDCEWKKNTISAYRASLFGVVEWAASNRLVDPREARSLNSTLEQAKTEGRPRRRPAGLPPRASAKKRKSLLEAEQRALRNHLAKKKSEVAILLGGFMHFGPQLGLRPAEYAEASVGHRVLHVRCAKATNGRGIAARRTIDLRDNPGAEILALKGFLALFRRLLGAAGSWSRLHARLSKALTRACETLMIPRVSLYTLRHQMLATAKRSMTPQEVAALAGHKTTKTATQHYARRRSGWKTPLRVYPAPDLVTRVRTPSRSPRASVSCKPAL